jgi:hypothetical protein
MDRSRILAHRGLWSRPEERNTQAALFGALRAGYGIETDFRDRAGILFVSHDPPGDGDILTAAALFDEYARHGHRGRLALNVKADGLQGALREALHAIPVERYYAFDMSVPDALGYLCQEMPIYTRMSEYEPEPAFATEAAGIWVDDFSGDYPQVEVAQRLLREGRRVALVSPELHGRPPEALWDAIRAAGLHADPRFEICTDFPDRVFDILGTE